MSKNIKNKNAFRTALSLPYGGGFSVRGVSVWGGSLSRGVSVWGAPCLETGHMISVTNEKCHYIGIPVYVGHQYRQVFAGSQSPLESLGLRHCTI